MMLGIAQTIQIGAHWFLSFSSWYVELLVRHAISMLGIDSAPLAQVKNMMPPLDTINKEAYYLIHDIETHARNFVVAQLTIYSDDDEILIGWDRKTDPYSNQRLDAAQRADRWRNNNTWGGLVTDLNPQIAYTTTRELGSVDF